MAEVRVRTDFPFEVEVVEHVWVPLADGTRLAARLWLPAGAGPVPAVLCSLPYRKSDGVAAGDDQEMRYTAGHGYAGVRIDVRGTGDSEGILLDEYTEREQLDCVEAIAWIARQPWCDGSVGMTGYSWGGFSSLQAAARRPPELKAIMSFYASDDRYADDVHYRGGCVLAMDLLHWATCMLGFNAMPPDPRVAGDAWRDRWLERLKRTPPFVEAWLSHQRRDGYWRHGSVCEDYAAIRCPVYAVGGWTDGYTNAVLRLLEGLTVPRRGLIGPWGHNDPVRGIPGPPVGILQEQVRWWDRWLKGVDNGIEDEPMLTFWLQDWVEPHARLEHRPGRWAAEERWPSQRLRSRRFALGEGSLGEAAAEARLELRGVQTCGLDSGAWCADGHSDDLPPDQRAEDGKSLCFTSRPLDEPLEVLGRPEVVLELASDRPQALVAVRLCDVAPDGASLLVTRGLLNLTHRESHERPEPLEPGRRYTVRLSLDAIAHRFRAGHRLRLALSPTYWPWAWPSPEPVTLSLFTGRAARLELPARPPREEDATLALPEPEEPPPYPTTALRADRGRRAVEVDLATGRASLRFDWDLGGRVLLEPTGTELEYTSSAVYSIVEGDPLSARVEVENGVELRRGEEWDVRCRAAGTMTSTASDDLDGVGLPRHERARSLRGRHAGVRRRLDVRAAARPGLDAGSPGPPKRAQAARSGEARKSSTTSRSRRA